MTSNGLKQRAHCALAAAALLSLGACGSLDPAADRAPADTATASNVGLPSERAQDAAILPYSAEDALFDALPKGADARAILCAPPLGQDVVVSHLCTPTPPQLRGIRDLQAVLGFGFANPSATGSNGGTDGNPVYAITGHSSSLVLSGVSTVNPRTVICRDFGKINVKRGDPTPANPNFFACMGFTRGDNIVEVATTDAGNGDLNFYIIKFETACSLAHTCTPADLFMPAVEQEWVEYNAYEDDPFLKNTILDCRQCHQNGGATLPFLRLQETTAPFTHFFSNSIDGGKALLNDFWAAHGQTEDYGPIPAALIAGSDGGKLAAFVQAEGFLGAQVNPFPSAAIEAEVQQSSPRQPVSNALAGKSSIWQTLFVAFQNGTAIPPPYHDVKVTDATKLAVFTSAYQAVKAGTAGPETLPDVRDMFSDDPQIRAELSLGAVPGASVTQLFTSMCMQCHNDGLDQNLTRARFSVTALLAGKLTAAEKSEAIARLLRGAEELQLMPPKRFRSLTTDERQMMIKYLEQP